MAIIVPANWNDAKKVPLPVVQASSFGYPPTGFPAQFPHWFTNYVSPIPHYGVTSVVGVVAGTNMIPPKPLPGTGGGGGGAVTVGYAT